MKSLAVKATCRAGGCTSVQEWIASSPEEALALLYFSHIMGHGGHFQWFEVAGKTYRCPFKLGRKDKYAVQA